MGDRQPHDLISCLQPRGSCWAALGSRSPTTGVTLVAWRPEPATTHPAGATSSMGPRPGEAGAWGPQAGGQGQWVMARALTACPASRITNSPVADLLIVWARCEDSCIRGFLLEKGTLHFHFHQEAFEFLFTFCHKGGVICISEVIDISPGNLDSSLCFFQSSISHDVLCI